MSAAQRLHAIEEQFANIELLLKQLRQRIAGVAEDVRTAALVTRKTGKKR